MFDSRVSVGDALGELSHAEMLALTGLTRDRLLTWYKRGTLPDRFTMAPGSGNQRRYKWRDALVLTAIRELADAGIPIEDSVELGERFATMFHFRILGDFVDMERGLAHARETLLRWPTHGLVAIVQHPKDWKPDDQTVWTSRNFTAIAIGEDDTFASFGKWLREFGGNFFITIDTMAAVSGILQGLAQVAKARKGKVSRQRRK